MAEKMTGGCLCGDVRYEFTGLPPMMGHCHCSRCRRFTGGACSWEMSLLREAVRLVQGDDVLGEYEGRNFCTRCGSSLFWGYRGGDGKPFVGVAAGTLDPGVDPGVRPMAHGHVASKAPWVALDDALPKLAGELDSDVFENDDPACAAAPLGATPDEVTGACFCGGVRYAVTPPVRRAYYCHCSLCRRFTGNAAAVCARVSGEQLRITAGEKLLRTFRWEDRKEYVFCSDCGSSLCVTAQWPPAAGAWVSMRMGTFDGDPGVRPQSHIYVGSKAVWEEITDDLPQFAEGMQ